LQEKKYNGRLGVGDRVYEVFIYKVRPASVVKVSRVRLDDPARTRTLAYTIVCDDGSASPRYLEGDVDNLLFTDREAADRQCELFRKNIAPLGSRGNYNMSGTSADSRARRGFRIFRDIIDRAGERERRREKFGGECSLRSHKYERSAHNGVKA